MNKALFTGTAAFSFTLSLLGSFNAQAVPSNTPVIGEFGRKELSSEASCGIYLSKLNRANTDYRWVFFYDDAARMKIDNRMIILKPTTPDSPSNSLTSRSFVSKDKSVSVRISLRKGTTTSQESFRVSGTIKVRKNGREVNLQVKGEAGC